jgi:hypothetical protein
MRLFISIYILTSLSAAWPFLGLAADTVVADYRDNFQGSTFPPGWQYLWNKNGSIADPPTNLVPLQADSATVWDTDAANPGRPDPAPGTQLFLSGTGGHPGSGNPDRYAIAAYTIKTNDGAGYYAITGSFVTMTNPNLGGSEDGLEVRVFTSTGITRIIKTVFALSTIGFDGELGWLNPGDTIYVAFGENGNHNRDAFQHDFSIVRRDTPPPGLSDITQLDFFTQGFPHVSFFRREPVASQLAYAAWRSNFSRLDGCLMKGLKEEVITLAPNILPYLQTFAGDFSNKFAICHLNGLAGDPVFLGTNFFAGHYLYLPGSLLTQSVAPGDTVLNVQNGALFRLGIGIDASRNDEIVLVPLDGGGNKLWEQAEHASVLSISGNQLTVTRNFRNLAPAPGSFTAGQTWVAPHAYNGPWGNVTNNNLLWAYNFSDRCPTNALGQDCGEALAQLFAGLFAPGGRLDRFRGLQFDIARAETARFNGRQCDINNDGAGDDNGFLATDRINHYAVGLRDFYRKLRDALGPGRLIMADGGEQFSQRAVDQLNGMEAEGFAGPNDDPYLKEWSSNLNRYDYWKLARRQPLEFNYIVHKDTLLTNPPIHLARQVLATAQALGVGLCYTIEPALDAGETVGIWDELRRGTDNVFHWLGQPRGPLLRLATNAPDLLDGAGVAMSSNFVATWTSPNAAITNDGATLRVERKPGSTTNLTLNLPFASLSPAVALPGGDLFLRFQIQADAMNGYDAAWPRKLSVTVSNRVFSANTADELFALAGTAGFAEVAFYYRDAGPAANLVLSLKLEGTNAFALRNFTVHNAPDLIAREFENGAVLINPSMGAANFDLATLFPDRSFRRLVGRTNQAPAINDGSPVGASVAVPARDGLFLVKTADTSLTDTDGDALPDAWELQFAPDLTVLGVAGNPNSGSDHDGDGTTDRLEHAAGTDPTDAGSQLILDVTELTGAELRASWDGIPGKRYRLEASLDLATWFTVGSPYDGLGVRQTAYLPSSFFPGTEKVFLRVRPL